MTKDNGCSKYTGLSYYMPRKYSPKRAYPWLTDITRLGMSSNKKQAIEAAINGPNVLLRSVYPLDKANVSLGTNSCCPSIPGQVQGCLVARPSPSLYTASVSLGTDGTSVGVVEPNAPLTSESNPNLVGNTKNQKACRGKKLAMASEPGPNIYPLSNQSLLSTGVFDGAPVKYTLRSRDIILHGVIKGSKILCSCNECNNSKYITPCDFERHAGGKTRKPYSCIYLKNGKSINQVCQEVRTTPKDMLFHRLPEIAGSAFGWLSFNTWKGPSDLDSSPAAPPPTKMSNFKSLQ
ncbi:uncharacterized protein LOC115682208 [Syzygium oleosum]|uniref:uncharacterized protein LOC115682208 n=1 Tax=Syzygium oleosum TaxID=219896 RepID=UPI0024BA3232|nr:uncharacterized protein LOC115682208 [Syzygium oleosum]